MDKETEKKQMDIVAAAVVDVLKRIDELEQAINARFEKMKKVIGDYLTIGNEFALGAFKTSLKSV